MSTKGLILALALVAVSGVGFAFGGPLGLLPLLFLGHATGYDCECDEENEK